LDRAENKMVQGIKNSIQFCEKLIQCNVAKAKVKEWPSVKAVIKIKSFFAS
jgi:hypothetical protein